jgi:hypothetical protein
MAKYIGKDANNKDNNEVKDKKWVKSLYFVLKLTKVVSLCKRENMH